MPLGAQVEAIVSWKEALDLLYTGINLFAEPKSPGFLTDSNRGFLLLTE